VEVAKGATTAHVRIDIGGGAIITASITNEAVDELRLREGDDGGLTGVRPLSARVCSDRRRSSPA
jgi:hypothetical protein